MKKLIIVGILVIIGLGIALVYLNTQYSKTAATTPNISSTIGVPAGGTEKIKVISNGESIDLNQYLVKDYVVVFDFYADWCGPCKILSPQLEELVNKNKDVLLRKINIVNWGSDIAKQYAIQFVPNVRVYDKQGQMVGEPTPGYSQIAGYIEQARQ
jgi:thiol-disulfide isomerase/thioredoxin